MNEIIPWWDWLLCSSERLVERGLNPEHRVRYTGHRRALSMRWAPTIGMWCLVDPTDIMKKYDPKVELYGKEDRMKVRWAYDTFRNRHHLRLRNQFMKEHEFTSKKTFIPIGTVLLATFAHHRVATFLARGTLSVGEAAALAAKYDTSSTEKTSYMGLLPVEMLLYYTAIQQIFEETNMTRAIWVKGQGGESWLTRAQFWADVGCDETVMLPEAAYERYAADHEEED